jgi:hypothetical protein
VFPYQVEYLCAECRCYNPKDEDKVFYRGVCHACVEIPMGEWLTKKTPEEWSHHRLCKF